MSSSRIIMDKAKALGLLRALDQNHSQGTGKGSKETELSARDRVANSTVHDLPASPLPLASERPLEKPKITVIDYDEQHYHEAEVRDVADWS